MRSARQSAIVTSLSTATTAVSRKIRGIDRRTRRMREIMKLGLDAIRWGSREDSSFLFGSYLIRRHALFWETISLRFSLTSYWCSFSHALGIIRRTTARIMRIVSHGERVVNGEDSPRGLYVFFSIFFYSNHLYSFHELHATCCRSSLIVVSIVPCVFLFQWMLAARTAWPPRRCVNS